MYKLTKAEGASKSSNNSHSVFGIRTELKQNWREGIPLALQLWKKHYYEHLNVAKKKILNLENE